MNESDLFFLKLTGKVNIPVKLEIGHNYRCTIDGSVTTETKEDNENGSYSYIAKFEPITCEIVKEHGETIKGKDARKRSQQIRAILYRLWESNPSDQRDHEVAYDETMKYILAHIHEYYEQAKK